MRTVWSSSDRRHFLIDIVSFRYTCTPSEAASSRLAKKVPSSSSHHFPRLSSFRIHVLRTTPRVCAPIILLLLRINFRDLLENAWEAMSPLR